VLAFVFCLAAGGAEFEHAGGGHAAAGGAMTNVMDVLFGDAFVAEHCHVLVFVARLWRRGFRFPVNRLSSKITRNISVAFLRFSNLWLKTGYGFLSTFHRTEYFCARDLEEQIKCAF
jgi:hypothetical protein